MKKVHILMGTQTFAAWAISILSARVGVPVEANYVPTFMSGSLEAIQDTKMNFTFLESSNLYLFAVSLLRPCLFFDGLKTLAQDSQFYCINGKLCVIEFS